MSGYVTHLRANVSVYHLRLTTAPRTLLASLIPANSPFSLPAIPSTSLTIVSGWFQTIDWPAIISWVISSVCSVRLQSILCRGLLH